MREILEFIYHIALAFIILILIILVMNLFRYVVIYDLSVREVLSHPVEYSLKGTEETWLYLKEVFTFLQNQFQKLIG